MRINCTQFPVVLLSALMLVQLCASTDYGDVKPDLDYPFAFHMFENVNLCHDVFNQERKFIQDLKDTRSKLSGKLESLKVLQKDTENEEALGTVSLSSQDTLTMKSRFNESTKSFPEDIDVEGAVNAMVQLYDTYRFNITALLEGVIHVPYYEQIGQSIVIKVIIIA